MRTIIKRLAFYGMLVMTPIISPAAAALKVNTPSQVCDFLSDFGLATSGWKNLYAADFGCSSPYKELGTGTPLANNLAFYAEGSRTTVAQVKLVLNVNNRAAAKSAHSELLKVAEALSVKVSGQQLPQALREAIQGGKKSSAKVFISTLEVIREEWPTGKGYELQFITK
jgi:hypothetical protein